MPRPLYPYETWQAITSPPSLEAVPRNGWGGVFWNKNHVFMRQWWEKFAEFYADEHGEEHEQRQEAADCSNFFQMNHLLLLSSIEMISL